MKYNRITNTDNTYKNRTQTRPIRLFCLIVMIICPTYTYASHEDKTSTPYREYQLKAAFIYNFMKFIDWPEPKNEKSEKTEKENPATREQTMVITIIGENPFADSFKPIVKKKIKGNKLIVNELHSLAQYKAKASNKNDYIKELAEYRAAINDCHLLFVCASERTCLSEIIDLTKGQNILTVSEIPGFLEKDGIINFITEESKIRFEINVAAAKKENYRDSRNGEGVDKLS